MLADEFIFFQDVELLSCGELFSADAACEAFEVEHAIPCLPHQVLGTDALQAAGALGAEASAKEMGSRYKNLLQLNENSYRTLQLNKCPAIVSGIIIKGALPPFRLHFKKKSSRLKKISSKLQIS